MRNLLSAECLRLRKSRLFWLMLLAAAALAVPPFQEELRKAAYSAGTPEGWAVDEALFQSVMLIGCLFAAFIPLFWGAEYSDGTLRNKLIAGHRRSSVYLSTLLTSMLTGAAALVLSWGFSGLLAVLTKGRIGMDAGQFARYLLAGLCCVFAFASLYVLLSLLIPNRAYALFGCIAALLAMILLVGSLQRSLLQAELVSDILEFVDGKPVWSEPHPNPFYISGWKRTLFSYFVDFLPAGQSVQLSNLEAERVARLPALSLLFTLLTTGIGLLAFSRKDIK